MFGNCFTPKPARSGATAQLSVVDHKSQKFTESYPNAQPKASSVVAPKPTSHVSGGQDLVRKLSESAEKRCVLRSAHKHNPVQMAEEDVSAWLPVLYGQTYEREDCCTLHPAALGIITQLAMLNEEFPTRQQYCQRGITGWQAQLCLRWVHLHGPSDSIAGQQPHDERRDVALQQPCSVGQPIAIKAMRWCRSHLASLLKEHCLVKGGDSNVKQWLKDVGVNGSVASALKVGCWRNWLLACWTAKACCKSRSSDGMKCIVLSCHGRGKCLYIWALNLCLSHVRSAGLLGARFG